MRDLLTITDLTFTSASRSLRATGLLGWVRVILNATLVIDDISVRLTRENRYVLSWPAPSGTAGPRRVVRPVDKGAREYLEQEILGELHRRGVMR